MEGAHGTKRDLMRSLPLLARDHEEALPKHLVPYRKDPPDVANGILDRDRVAEELADVAVCMRLRMMRFWFNESRALNSSESIVMCTDNSLPAKDDERRTAANP